MIVLHRMIVYMVGALYLYTHKNNNRRVVSRCTFTLVDV